MLTQLAGLTAGTAIGLYKQFKLVCCSIQKYNFFYFLYAKNLKKNDKLKKKFKYNMKFTEKTK